MARQSKKNVSVAAAVTDGIVTDAIDTAIDTVIDDVQPSTDAVEEPEVKKTRKKGNTIEEIIKLIKAGKLDKAIVALEKLGKTTIVKKERKSRPPTEFNLFVSEKMKELKDSGLSTNERMKRCAELWRESKVAK